MRVEVGGELLLTRVDEQFVNIDTQKFCELADVVNGCIVHCALDLTHIGPMESCLNGEIFLG